MLQGGWCLTRWNIVAVIALTRYGRQWIYFFDWNFLIFSWKCMNLWLILHAKTDAVMYTWCICTCKPNTGQIDRLRIETTTHDVFNKNGSFIVEFSIMINPKTPGNTWVCSQHCGYWCPGAKAPGHQYPHCWLNIHCIGPVSYKNIAHKVNSIRKWSHISKKKMTQSFKD